MQSLDSESCNVFPQWIRWVRRAGKSVEHDIGRQDRHATLCKFGCHRSALVSLANVARRLNQRERFFRAVVIFDIQAKRQDQS